jgi:bifunctional non-homologous end joining protein LigD
MTDPSKPAQAKPQTEAQAKARAKAQTPPPAAPPGLDEYRRKRDFSRTSEPAGGQPAHPSTTRRTFVVHKHDASQLHYDLRLELGGVLKSWAVPKGPSLDPKERRLAVQVEDHPLEYAAFEGTIPEGEYGAGTVMLWDSGWWEPDEAWMREGKGDRGGKVLTPEQALAKGDLKFVLHGQKLRGSWALVQMKGRGDKNWLLIKHRDEWARPGSNITQEAPDSVATGRSLEQIAAGAPPNAAPDAPSSAATHSSTTTHSSSASRVFRLGEKEVHLTHLDRLYYPQAGVTKGRLLDYYLQVSPYLLPHLRGRPLTLERWPGGVEDGSFFQKDASSYFPPWLRTHPVERKDHQKIIHYPLVEDEADLLYLVNQGTLTFHAQMMRIEDPDHPDLMVLDIDPPETPEPSATSTTPFQRAAEVAFLLRDRLREAGYDPVVKTSGKRGVHLAFPLKGDLDYSQARAQLMALFAQLAKRYPRLLTTHIRKDKRKGRVYLDALRMSPGATIVPPYVARPTPEATVSMPVTWEELETLADGRGFTVLTAPARLSEIGDLWAGLVSNRPPAPDAPPPAAEAAS